MRAGFDGIGDMCVHKRGSLQQVSKTREIHHSEAHLIKQFADLYGVTQAQDCPVRVKVYDGSCGW